MASAVRDQPGVDAQGYRSPDQRLNSGVTMVEVLVAATIGVVITGMLIAVWISLSSSWTATARGAEARDFARDAVARMSRELRDMEPRVGQATAIIDAEPFRVRFTTTFNLSGNANASVTPVLTEYSYEQVTKPDGTQEGVLHWRRDTDHNDQLDLDRVVSKNLLNDPVLVDEHGSPAEAVFIYTYILDNARMSSPSPPAGADILAVRVRVIVDMQPGRPPRPLDLTTTVQLRNQQ